MSELEALKNRFRRLAEYRQERDQDKLTAKKSEEAYREYEAELLAVLEDSDLKGAIQFDFGGDLGTISFQRRKTIFGKVIDKQLALQSLAAEDLEEQMTGTTIEARRLNELVRERDEAGEDLPDGIGFYEKKFVSISHKRPS